MEHSTWCTRKKLPAICEQLRFWNPDIVGLSEFRESATSQAIAAALGDMGLIHQQTTVEARGRGVNTRLTGKVFGTFHDPEPVRRKVPVGQLRLVTTILDRRCVGKQKRVQRLPYFVKGQLSFAVLQFRNRVE